jgi:hypothetical protein
LEEEKDLTQNSLKADFYDISHSDIDSSLQMYFGNNEYCFKSRKCVEATYYAILKMRKNGKWMVQEAVESSEVEMYNEDELITALIEKIISKKESRKPFLILTIIGIIILIPILFVGYTVLGPETMTEYGMSYIITGIVVVLLLPFACVIGNRKQRRIDRILYSTRVDYLQILQKQADAEDNEYIAREIVKRIERLKSQGTLYT